MRRSYKLYAILLLLLVAIAAFMGLMREFRVHLALSGNTITRIGYFTQTPPPLPTPTSARSSRDLITACAYISYKAPALKADEALDQAFNKQCLLTAQALLDSAPSNARALAVVFMTKPELDLEALRLAQLAAPYDAAPLRMRIWGIVDRCSKDPEFLKIAREDFDRVIGMRWGLELLARAYLDCEAYQPSIIAAADARGAQVQRQFLHAVRRRLGRTPFNG